MSLASQAMRTALAAVAVLAVTACGSDGGGAAPDSGALPDAVADLPAGDPGPGDTAGDAAPDTGPGDDAPGEVQPDLPPDPQDAADVPPSETTDGSEEPPSPHPWFDRSGHVELQETPSAGSQVSAFFWTAPDPVQHGLAASEGACELWLRVPEGTCDTPCDPWTQYCGIDDACHPMKERTHAGTIQVTGLTAPLKLVPDASGWYTTDPVDPPANLFAAGASIVVKAQGGDVPAFEAAVHGVGDMTTTVQHLDLEDGKDAVVPFTPRGDGATVELALVAGWHGAPPTGILWCSVADADGKVVVPKALVEGFPPIGEIGLFQHPSLLRRVSRAWVDDPSGPIEVLVASQAGLSVTH
jgi:hypothetical protein